MDEKLKLEAWADGCIRKHSPDAVCILMDIIQAGLCYGEATAKDVRDRHYKEPNIIGCTFRLLKHCGFQCDRSRPPVKMQVEKKHARWVPIWILTERWKAELVLAKVQRAIFQTPDGQGVLAL